MLRDEQLHEVSLDDVFAIQSTHHAGIYGKNAAYPGDKASLTGFFDPCNALAPSRNPEWTA